MSGARPPRAIAARVELWAAIVVVITFSLLFAGPGAGPRGVGAAWIGASGGRSSDPVGGLSVLATVPVGATPELATWNASAGLGGGDVYVANSGSSNVSILNGTSWAGTVNVSTEGVGPFDPIDDPANSSVLLTYHAYGSPHVVSALHGPVLHGTEAVSQVTGITVDDEPVLGVYDVSNGSVFLTDDGTTVGAIVVGAANQSVFATVPTGPGSDPCDLAVDPPTGWIYVVDLGDANVSIVRGLLLPVVTVHLPTLVNSTYPVLSDTGGTFRPDYASDIAYDPQNGDMYIADSGASTVSVLNQTRVLANVAVGSFPYSVAYDPTDGDVYVTNVVSGTVSLLQGTVVVGTVHVGDDPIGVTYDASDGDMLVANLGSANVTVLSGTSVVGSLTVGTDPVFEIYDTVNDHAYVVNQGSDSVSVLGAAPGAGTWGLPPWGWGLTGIAAMLLLVAIVIVVSRRRERRAASAPASPPSGPSPATPSSPVPPTVPGPPRDR